jgi:large subunit ribosomal protein L35Ae
MEGTIINYRMSRHRCDGNYMVIQPVGVDNKEGAEKLIGKIATWITPGKDKNEIKGKIVNFHGRNGAVRVLFEKGLPGQALGTKVNIN